ncbi:MAG: hypothetical protein WKF81_12190 [Thermomicrobiales bacterium]
MDRPLCEGVPVSHEIVQGYCKSARRLHLMDACNDDLSCSRVRTEVRDQLIPFIGCWQNRSSSSIETQVFRGSIEGAKHERDPTIIAEVSRRFVSATCHIKIRNRSITQNPEAIEAFRRGVDVTFGGGWGTGNEEHVLGSDELHMPIVHRVKEFAHG